MQHVRTFGVLSLAMGLVAAFGLAVGTPRIAAQPATPVAVATPASTPVAGSVPCTSLFGIAPGNACLIVVHGSPDAAPLDVYVDGVLVFQGLGYGDLGDFVPVAAGERQIQLVPSGAAVTEAMVNARVALADGIAYEMAAFGPATDVELLVLPVDTRPVAAGAARLRVVHASPDSPEIDLAVTGGNALLQGVGYPAIAGYVDVPSGTFDLEARVAGTTDVALPLPGILLAPNTVYTLYVIGQVADGSLGFNLVPVLVSPDIAAAATPVG